MNFVMITPEQKYPHFENIKFSMLGKWRNVICSFKEDCDTDWFHRFLCHVTV